MDLIGDANAASAIACITRSSHPAQKSEDAAVVRIWLGVFPVHHERAIIEHPRKLDAPTPDKRKLDS